MCPKTNLCYNWRWGGEGAIKVESKLGKIIRAPITKDKIIICIYAWKKCSIWNYSQSSESNY